MSISQKELASELNLSTATVSRSLRDDPGISLETRSLVLHHAVRRGYQGKIGKIVGKATDLSSANGAGETTARKIFTVLIQTDEQEPTSNATLVPILGSMSLAAAEHNVALLFHCVPKPLRDAIDLPENQPEILRNRQCGGVALIHDFDSDAVARLARQAPVVSLNIPYPEAGVDCIEPDNFWSMAGNVRHLLSLGHRKLAYVDIPYDSTIRGERMGGYLFAAREGADAGSATRVFRPAGVKAADLDGLRPLLADGGVTGLVCFNDYLAFHVLSWLRENGFDCPRDVSVTGLDHAAGYPGMPTLTTGTVSGAEVGRAAVLRLVEREANPRLQPMRFVIGGVFIKGESTGPVAR